ncbi:MAG TPA: hypothetical protein VE981_10080 [Planctomycetota bacterium]|nr:hypothetical protein [Planctomycetota bacterium]
MRSLILTAALAILAAGSGLARGDDDADAQARQRALQARNHCADLLADVEGVSSVNYGGSGVEFRLMIIVRGYKAKQAADRKIGGDAYEGVPILWSVSSPAPEPAAADATTPEAPQPETTRAAPRPAAAADGPDCDIVRAQLGLPGVRHPVGGSSPKSWVPCKVWLRAVTGAGGGHSYLYTKHRPGCPYMDGIVSPVYREGITYPTELRGSDSNWGGQVRQDLEYKFPYPGSSMEPKPYPPRREVATGSR